MGHWRTNRQVRAMSALPPKADIPCAERDVRFVPKADSCTAIKPGRAACSGGRAADRTGQAPLAPSRCAVHASRTDAMAAATTSARLAAQPAVDGAGSALRIGEGEQSRGVRHRFRPRGQMSRDRVHRHLHPRVFGKWPKAHECHSCARVGGAKRRLGDPPCCRNFMRSPAGPICI